MSKNDIVVRNREIVVRALSMLRPEWSTQLDLLKKKAEELLARPDLVWHMIVQSLSGMGNNRGYFNLIENLGNYNRICWQRVGPLSGEALLHALGEALSLAKVRMAARKAEWLHTNHQRVWEMGGIDEARQRMRDLRGYLPKLHFFQQFKGISEKYGRNIWMDLYDVDFRNSIAIDTRIKDICSLIGIDTQDYQQAEGALLNLAREAGRNGWEMDRLLFHFYQDFKGLLSGNVADGMRIQRQPDTAVGQFADTPAKEGNTMEQITPDETKVTAPAEKTGNTKRGTPNEMIKRAEQELLKSGFTVEVLPGRRGFRGTGDLVVSAPDAVKFAKIRVRGRGQAENPCWFSLTFFDEDIQSAMDAGVEFDDAWKYNVAKYDFFILVSLPLNKMWLFTPRQIVELIELNLKECDWPNERRTNRKVEMNFDVQVEGKRLSQMSDYDSNLINDANNFSLLREWLTE